MTPTRHENVQTAVDKEIHQDHYHTSVQPVQDREVLPEKHQHNIVGVEHRSFEHGDARADEGRLSQEAAQFRDERVIGDTKHTHSVAPAVAGEHIHHHVHETIQPVVQKGKRFPIAALVKSLTPQQRPFSPMLSTPLFRSTRLTTTLLSTIPHLPFQLSA